MRKYLGISLILAIISGFVLINDGAALLHRTDISDIAEDKADAVVMITNDMGPNEQDGTDSKSLGTGFFVDENLIVTNHHVIENSKSLMIKGKNSSKLYDSEVIASDKFSDLAIVKIKDWDDYKAMNGYSKLEFKSSRDLKLGTMVWSIGHPWGLVWSVSKGVVSSPSRRMDGNLNFLIQTDTKIYQGNSGGPLLTEDGKVVGVNDKMLAQTGGSFGLAIPSDLAMRIINDLKKDGKAEWAVMGVKLGTSDDKKHVAVKDIMPGSAGEKAGLLPGDILLHIHTRHTPYDGVGIVDSDTILDEMAIITPGDDVRLSIIRNGQEMDVMVKPDSKTSEELSPVKVQPETP